MRYRVRWTLDGFTIIEADSEEEAEEKFETSAWVKGEGTIQNVDCEAMKEV